MSSEDDAKRLAGTVAVDAFVHDGTCIGLGSGSTAFWAVQRVGERIASEGLRVRAVPTSVETEHWCRERNIPISEYFDEPIDVAIDGADEATLGFALLKGGGGALFREKAVALAATRFVTIVTERKIVERLGAFPLPVEIVPFALPYVREKIAANFMIQTRVREKNGATFITDNANLILDCNFGSIDDPGSLDIALREFHGVVATGLFVGIARHLIVASTTGTKRYDAPN